ncbi:MAG: protein translocase subunit SecD [Acidobacteriota bacterium]|nr:protein translocase subunit SecD [Acidobacteriota bacterium]
MKKNLLWKVVLILATLIVFVWGVFLGTDPAKSIEAIKAHGLLAGIQENIHLGLDLRGGTHLILQVQVNDAVNAETDQTVERLKDAMKKKNIVYGDVAKVDPAGAPGKIAIRGVDANSAGDLRTILTEQFGEYDFTTGSDSWTVSLKSQVEATIKQRAVEQAIETIRNRIDQLGVSEPQIAEHSLGAYQILVQLPGVDDPARVKEVMQSTAMLEIRQALDNGRLYSSEQEALAAHNGILPSDAIVMKGVNAHRSSGDAGGDVYYLISRVAAVSGRDLRSAESGHEENGRPDVMFTLTRDGGDRFYNFTSAHVGDYLAIVLDGKVQEVATIKEPIRDSGRISGSYTEQRTKDVAMVLRSGALPASIKYLEERTVGPSLGADSIRQGVRAAMVGMAAVMVFMLIYYRFAGINADLALVLNLVILLGFLGFTGATLTLPGIAGLILTVGMGVDSNVLIFERIREELRAGKTPPSAVEQGFGHAWVTIIDTHVTTIVSAAILFLFGTGPVKGFAVTLTFGLLANLFTAVFVSRTIFDSILNRHKRGEALSI